MKIKHPAVTSDVFKLVETVEFDLSVCGKFVRARVELFQDTVRQRHWRCHLWELDFYHIEGTFRDKGRKKRPQSDEALITERTWEISSKFSDFEAPNARAAMKTFLDRFQQYLKRVA
jgi:hypothetical protein